jgi:cytochrome c biogenesis protein CcmG, thiol:disulfide interchange protein DsbE
MRHGSYAPALSLLVVRFRPIVALTSLAGVALVALLLYGVSTQAANRTLDEQVARGQLPMAPDASRALPMLGSGGTRALASLRGKVVVLNFWSSWCTPCQAEAPLLEHAEQGLAHHDGTVLGVTYQDAASASEQFAREYHLTYPIVRDSTGALAHAFGTRQVPETFVIDRRGRIVAISRGEIEQDFLSRAIERAERV